MKEALEELRDACLENGFTVSEVDRLIDTHEDEIREEIYARDSSKVVENLLRNTRPIPVRIELHSNYDCINSHWFESQGGYRYQESYFGAMVDVLNLNPS